MDNYIYGYYQQIKDGSIVVNWEITSVYEFVINGLQNKKFFYNAKKAEKAIVFIESYCRHHEGELGGELIQLELWQKAMVSVIFGIVDSNGYRQFREVPIVVARKNGKTILASAIAAYMTYADNEYGSRTYFTAPKLDQARLCYEAFYQMVKTEEELDQRTERRRSDIYVEETNSSVQAIPFSSKKTDGLNPHLVVCDEFSSWPGQAGLKQYEVLKSALGARRQPLLLSISTAGYESEGIYDELILRVTRVLKGNSEETRLIGFIYRIEDIKNCFDINELRKANPNLGVSVSVEYLIEEARIASGSLSKKAEFLTKYCNIKQNSSIAWLNTDAIEKACRGPLNIEDFKESYVMIGIDLSNTTDLTSAVIGIERDGCMNLFAHFWLPSEKLQEATVRDNLPYNIYVAKGWLSLSGENFVDYKDVFNWVTNAIVSNGLYCLMIGYDRYSSTYLIDDFKKRGFHTDDVYQGTNLTSVIRELEGLIKDGKVNIGDNQLLKIHFLDAAMKVETETGKLKLIKQRANAHVDGVAASLDYMAVRSKYNGKYGTYLENRRES